MKNLELRVFYLTGVLEPELIEPNSDASSQGRRRSPFSCRRRPLLREGFRHGPPRIRPAAPGAGQRSPPTWLAPGSSLAAARSPPAARPRRRRPPPRPAQLPADVAPVAADLETGHRRRPRSAYTEPGAITATGELVSPRRSELVARWPGRVEAILAQEGQNVAPRPGPVAARDRLPEARRHPLRGRPRTRQGDRPAGRPGPRPQAGAVRTANRSRKPPSTRSQAAASEAKANARRRPGRGRPRHAGSCRTRCSPRRSTGWWPNGGWRSANGCPTAPWPS